MPKSKLVGIVLAELSVWMPFLLPNQQPQSTEGLVRVVNKTVVMHCGSISAARVALVTMQNVSSTAWFLLDFFVAFYI